MPYLFGLYGRPMENLKDFSKFGTGYPNSPLWSIGIELQFYFLFPLIYKFLSKSKSFLIIFFVATSLLGNLITYFQTEKIYNFQNFSKKEIEIVHLIEKLGYEVKHLHRIDTKICDIYVPKLNLIIEYFGDYWHCNPKKYNENYFNQKKNKYAKEIWEYDSNKIDLIKIFLIKRN